MRLLQGTGGLTSSTRPFPSAELGYRLVGPSRCLQAENGKRSVEFRTLVETRRYGSTLVVEFAFSLVVVLVLPPDIALLGNKDARKIDLTERAIRISVDTCAQNSVKNAPFRTSSS